MINDFPMLSQQGRSMDSRSFLSNPLDGLFKTQFLGPHEVCRHEHDRTASTLRAVNQHGRVGLRQLLEAFERFLELKAVHHPAIAKTESSQGFQAQLIGRHAQQLAVQTDHRTNSLVPHFNNVCRIFSIANGDLISDKIHPKVCL